MPNGPGHHRERRRASPRTLPRYHRERRRVSPRTPRAPPRADTAERPRCFPRALPLPTAEQPRRFPPPNSPGAFRGPRRFPSRTAPVLSASTRPRIILLSPAIPLNPAPLHLRQLVEPCHSLEPCSSTPASFPRALPFHTLIIPLSPASSNLLPDTFCLFQS